jgi:hypothetical protein
MGMKYSLITPYEIGRYIDMKGAEKVQLYMNEFFNRFYIWYFVRHKRFVDLLEVDMPENESVNLDYRDYDFFYDLIDAIAMFYIHYLPIGNYRVESLDKYLIIVERVDDNGDIRDK